MNPLNPLHGHASGASHSASPARNALAPATTETRFGDELQKAQGIALDAGTQPAETASPGMPSVTRRPAKATSARNGTAVSQPVVNGGRTGTRAGGQGATAAQLASGVAGAAGAAGGASAVATAMTAALAATPSMAQGAATAALNAATNAGKPSAQRTGAAPGRAWAPEDAETKACGTHAARRSRSSAVEDLDSATAGAADASRSVPATADAALPQPLGQAATPALASTGVGEGDADTLVGEGSARAGYADPAHRFDRIEGSDRATAAHGAASAGAGAGAGAGAARGVEAAGASRLNASDTQGVKRSADATDPTGARGSPGNAAATASLAATGASEFAGSPDVDASLVGFGSTEGFDPIQSAFEPAPASADAAHGWHLSGASAVIEAQRLFSLSGAGLAGVPAARAGTSTVQGTDTVPTEVNSKVPENGGTRADMLPWASGGRTHRHPLEAGVSAEPSAAASSTRALRLDEPPRAVASEGFAWAAAAATTAAASASSASAIAAASAFAATGPNTGEVARPAVVDATSNNAAMGIHTAQDSPIGPEVGSPGFAPALGARMVWLARDGVESAQLQLNPAELGPVAVRLAIDGSQVRVDMVAEAAFTRQALEESLPALASALRDAGFTLAGGGVSQQSQGHAQDPRSPAAASNGQSISNDALATASPAAGAARLSAQRPQGLVDLFA